MEFMYLDDDFLSVLHRFTDFAFPNYKALKQRLLNHFTPD